MRDISLAESNAVAGGEIAVVVAPLMITGFFAAGYASEKIFGKTDDAFREFTHGVLGAICAPVVVALAAGAIL